MEEIPTTLIVGGCMCIPQKEDILSDFPRAMREMDINWAVLTSSLLRERSEADSVPSLKTLRARWRVDASC